MALAAVARGGATRAAAALYERRRNHLRCAGQRFGSGLASAASLLRVARMKRTRRVSALAKTSYACNVGATGP
jgi:hypothetical protein